MLAAAAAGSGATCFGFILRRFGNHLAATQNGNNTWERIKHVYQKI